MFLVSEINNKKPHERGAHVLHVPTGRIFGCDFLSYVRPVSASIYISSRSYMQDVEIIVVQTSTNLPSVSFSGAVKRLLLQSDRDRADMAKFIYDKDVEAYMKLSLLGNLSEPLSILVPTWDSGPAQTNRPGGGRLTRKLIEDRAAEFLRRRAEHQTQRATEEKPVAGANTQDASELAATAPGDGRASLTKALMPISQRLVR